MEGHDFTAAIANARRLLAALQEQEARLIAQVPDIDDQRLDALSLDIDSARARVLRLERLRDAHASQLSVAARAELKHSLQEQAKTAKRLAMKDRVAIARELDAAIAALGPLLEKYQQASDQCRAAAHFVHKHDPYTDWVYPILNAAQGSTGGAAVALQWTLKQAGVGTVGIHLDEDFASQRIDRLTLEEAAKIDAERLGRYLDTCVTNFLQAEAER